MIQEFFYKEESRTYNFVQIPKVLISHPVFQQLGMDTRILYSLILDRMSLSQKNGYMDASGRAYVIYSQQEVMNTMACREGKAVKLIHELEKFGLIVRKKRGQGLPALIYPRNLLWFVKQYEEANEEKRDSGEIEEDLHYEEEYAHDIQETSFLEENFVQKSEIEKPNSKESNNRISRKRITAFPEMRKSHRNNTEYNKTNINNTYESNTEQERKGNTKGKIKERVDNQSVGHKPASERNGQVSEKMSAIHGQIRKTVEEQVKYDQFARKAKCVADYAAIWEKVQDLTALITEVLSECQSGQTIYVAKQFHPAGEVAERFRMLTDKHLEYVIGILMQSSIKPVHYKNYLVTMLYNAPLTCRIEQEKKGGIKSGA